MSRFTFLLWILTIAAGCVVESKPVTPPNDGGVEAGMCGTCPVDKPICNDELTCVQCTADEDEYCTDQGLVCDTGTSTCIGCSGDDDCTDAAAARCEDNVCRPCNEHAQCDSVEDIGVAESACDEGLCVDCTPETETETCAGPRTCNPATRECTEIFVGSLDVCDECVSDSQCGEDFQASEAHRCVPMYYPNMDTRFPSDQVGFCLKTTEGGCLQPYSITLPNRASLTDPDTVDDYCGVNENLATCPAVSALVNNQTCDTGSDEQCPQPSGLCRQVGDLENRCTYLCSDPVECKDPPVPGSTCGSSGSGGDDYCGG
ncbi:MAG: hypothetical protein ACN4G0_10865 [Polyangiales bacterium]